VSRWVGSPGGDQVAWLHLASEVEMYCMFSVPRRNSVVGPSDAHMSAVLAYGSSTQMVKAKSLPAKGSVALTRLWQVGLC